VNHFLLSQLKLDSELLENRLQDLENAQIISQLRWTNNMKSPKILISCYIKFWSNAKVDSTSQQSDEKKLYGHLFSPNFTTSGGVGVSHYWNCTSKIKCVSRIPSKKLVASMLLSAQLTCHITIMKLHRLTVLSPGECEWVSSIRGTLQRMYNNNAHRLWLTRRVFPGDCYFVKLTQKRIQSMGDPQHTRDSSSHSFAEWVTKICENASSFAERAVQSEITHIKSNWARWF
jgi:hypothetical protein